MRYSENNTYDISSRSHADVQSFVSRVFAVMGFGLLVTGVVSFMTLNSLTLWKVASQGFWFFAIGEIGLVIYLSRKLTAMPAQTALLWFLTYAGLNGLTLSLILNFYTHASIVSAFIVSGGMFGGMAVWGLTSKKDLTSMGALCGMGLLGLILASVVNLFLQSSAMQMVLSYAGVAIFIGLTAYDAQKIKMMGASNSATPGLAVLGALALYLDFINLFIHILRILGTRRN